MTGLGFEKLGLALVLWYGGIAVLALVVIATYNDLGRFWASMLKGVSSMF